MTDEEKDRDNLLKWLRLHLTDQVGAVTFARLLKHFGNIDNALAATSSQLTLVPRISHKKAELIVAARDQRRHLLEHSLQRFPPIFAAERIGNAHRSRPIEQQNECRG